MTTISRDTLHAYLNQFLQSDGVTDYAPNGLQVQGKNTIKKIVTGVTACQALLDKALAAKADAVLVHHGYFWKGEAPQVTGMQYQRLKALLTHNINLFGYHLPLDVHPELGNNVQLAQRLGISIKGELATATSPNLGLVGELAKATTLKNFGHQIETVLHRTPLLIPGHNRPIKTIAWCTGGAQDFIRHAANAGVDAYLTGEASERTTHMARELGIHFIGAGHHATERYGIEALGRHLAEKFGVGVEFVDIDNPV